MSTLARYERPGVLERVTSSTAFTVLLGIASFALAPSVFISLVAVFALPSLLADSSRVGSDVWAWLLLSAGGIVGYIGLFRARRPSASTADYHATLLCLGVGIVTGAAVLGMLVSSMVFDDVITAGAVVVPAIPIVAALGRIARLRRLRAAAEGRVLDSLPSIFLGVALGLAACAIAIGVRLASGS